MNIIKRSWCLDAAQGLHAALGADLAEVERQVTTGEAELWYLPEHGWLVTRIEQAAEQPPELVLVAGQGKDMHPVIEAFKEMASSNGMKDLRVHTKLAAMARKLEKHGAVLDEWVYRIPV